MGGGGEGKGKGRGGNIGDRKGSGIGWWGGGREERRKRREGEREGKWDKLGPPQCLGQVYAYVFQSVSLVPPPRRELRLRSN
jgi:hypothetical protein